MLKTYETSGNVLFEEKQRYPKWLNILIAGILLLTLVIILITGFAGPQEKRMEMWIGLAIAIPIEILVVILFQYVQLEKVVTSNGLYYRWNPWQKRYRYIEKETIELCEVRRPPFMNYGMGWFPGYGRYHRAGSGKGLQLYLKNGKRFYFSAADVDSFKRVMDHLTNQLTK
ncbi:MAG TPA: hypothetical protein VL095_13115 [Flavisolibacter sp.]|nr:hypothetical protein [Flavisolibacter sp.]